jgi:hypothetical protein
MNTLLRDNGDLSWRHMSDTDCDGHRILSSIYQHKPNVINGVRLQTQCALPAPSLGVVTSTQKQSFPHFTRRVYRWETNQILHIRRSYYYSLSFSSVCMAHKAQHSYSNMAKHIPRDCRYGVNGVLKIVQVNSLVCVHSLTYFFLSSFFFNTFWRILKPTIYAVIGSRNELVRGPKSVDKCDAHRCDL